MSKWDHLIESDQKLRGLQRRWKASNNRNDLERFLRAWARSGKSAKEFGLDPESRYEADFKAVQRYCKTVLKGKVIPSNLPSGSPVGAIKARGFIDFRLEASVEAPRRTVILLYPSEAHLRSHISGIDPFGVEHPVVYRQLTGSAKLLVTLTGQTEHSPVQEWNLIKRLANKAIKHVFDGRLRDR